MTGNYKDKCPIIDESCFVAQTAAVFGDVTVEKDASIWFGAVVRGDSNSIVIKQGVNIQDNCTLHANTGQSGVFIGEFSTIGHNVVLHGCKIGSCSMIGMSSTILDDVVIGDETIIGAGSLVTQGKTIPSGVLCMGSPAKVIRELTKQERESLRDIALHYIEFSKEYK